jgi:hypothetical protein
MFNKSLTLMLSICLAMLSFDATAQYKWQGPTDGLWSTAANWLDVSTGATATVTPGNTTDIIFDVPANVSIAGPTSCNSVKVTNNASVLIKASLGTSSVPVTLTPRSSSSVVKAVQVDAGAKLDFRSMSTGTSSYFYLRPLSSTFIQVDGTLVFSGGAGAASNCKFDWTNSALGSPIQVTVNGTYIQDTWAGTYVSPLSPSSITFTANSVFESKRSGGMIIPTATFDSLSLIKVSGIVGTGSQSWNGTAYTYGSFEYDNPTQTGTINLTLPTAPIFKGSFKILNSNSQKIRLATSPSNIIVKGDFIVANSLVNIANSAVTNTLALTTGNLSVNSGSLTLQETVTSTAAPTYVKVKGNLTVASGATLNSLSTNPAAPTIELNGTTNQNINAVGVVSNAQLFTLKMNNPAGATLLTDLSVPQLDLSSVPGGVINTGSNVLTISTPNTTLTTLKGGSATCHVVGKLKRNTASTSGYLFPVGTGNSFRKVTIYPTLTTGTNYQVQLALGPPPTGTLPTGIDHVSPSESWDISQPGGTIPAFISLSSDNGITVPSELRVLHYNTVTSTWEDLGNDGNAGTVAGLSTVTSTNASTSFSPFAMGATAAPNNPLPVKLIRFEAISAKNNVDLTWETAFERNASTFEVQYSVDGKSFSTFATVQAKGNSDSNQKYNLSHQNFVNGANFYRLHIVDNDSKTAYSKVVTVNMNSNHSVKVYPTTTSDMITIELKNDIETAYQIINNTGAVMMEGTVSNKQNISVANLNQGVYFIKMANNETVSFIKQ